MEIVHQHENPDYDKEFVTAEVEGPEVMVPSPESEQSSATDEPNVTPALAADGIARGVGAGNEGVVGWIAVPYCGVEGKDGVRPLVSFQILKLAFL